MRFQERRRAGAGMEGRVSRMPISKKLLATFAAAAWLAGAMAAPEAAAARRVIHDAETQTIIRSLAAPLLKAAELDPAGIDIVVILDPSINAFVAGGPYIFINTGLILATTEVGQLMGVLAHEIGHLRGGHVLRTRNIAGLASKAAVLSMILGAAAVAAGQGDAGAALLHGGRASATGAFLAFSRGQEAAADQTALALLAKIGQSPRGLYDFMALLAGQEALLDANRDPYGRTHPFSRDRLATIERALTAAPARAGAPTPRLAADFARLRAKLIAYLSSPARVRQQFPGTDQSLPARYARAIAAHRAHQSATALAGLDTLIAGAPADPFFVATRGQIQLESGDAAGAETSYRRALRLAAAAPLSRAARAILTRDLATALLAGNSAAKDTEARDLLRPIAPWAGESPGYWRQRAIAHGRLGEAGAAALAHAEGALRRGRLGEARDFAARARRQLTVGTPEHLRALDIENAAKNQLETR